MPSFTKQLNQVKWSNGIVTRKEAERFVTRFAKVLLEQAVANKVKVKKETRDGDRSN